MIRIKFEEGQGLGNQLWLFSAAKSISEKLNYKLEIENFDAESFPFYWHAQVHEPK